MKIELKDGPPPSTEFASTLKKDNKTEIFSECFIHFLKYAKLSKEYPVLLILDEHSTYTRNFDFVEKAKNSHTTVI